MKKFALCLLITSAISLAWFGVDTMTSIDSEWRVGLTTAVIMVALTCIATILGTVAMIFIVESDNYGP